MGTRRFVGLLILVKDAKLHKDQKLERSTSWKMSNFTCRPSSSQPEETDKTGKFQNHPILQSSSIIY
ncbi:hypothetical protein CapIbe_001545 [Capra ibex]